MSLVLRFDELILGSVQTQHNPEVVPNVGDIVLLDKPYDVIWKVTDKRIRYSATYDVTHVFCRIEAVNYTYEQLRRNKEAFARLAADDRDIQRDA